MSVMTKTFTRSVLATVVATTAMTFGLSSAIAQSDFPERPVEVVTHASPGGGTDTTARTLLIGTRRALGEDMRITPRTGGGGVLAMNYVNEAERDGHTLMAITPTHLFAIARNQGPLEIDDLVGVVRTTDDPVVVMVRADSDYETLDDLIEAGRDNPIKWGTTQIGGIDHVAGATLADEANTEISVVPFSGGGEIVTNLMGGNIDASGLNITEAIDQIEGGDFRALAVMAKERMSVLPDVPTTVELGYDVTFSTVRGVVALKGVPQERLDILEEAMLEGMQHSAYQAYLTGTGLDGSSIGNAEEWNEQIRDLYEAAEKAMADLGMVEQ